MLKTVYAKMYWCSFVPLIWVGLICYTLNSLMNT